MGQSNSKSLCKSVEAAAAGAGSAAPDRAGVLAQIAPPEKQKPFARFSPDVFKKALGDLLDLREQAALAQTSKSHYFLFKPQIAATKLPFQLLKHVAHGEQHLAENMVKGNPKLLLARSPVTDYSGRRFASINAYEYAYWAMDTHMRRMLETYMDNKIREKMLNCIDAIDQNGLMYEQQGGLVEHSKHFDFCPLLSALNEYAQCYSRANSKAMDGVGMKAAWLKVAIVQRNLPVHAVNEYCRLDRSFDPTPEFDEKTLPRTTTFYSFHSFGPERFFPLAVPETAIIASDFALVRAGQRSGAQAESLKYWGAGDVALVDLAAISRLAEVRTAELKLSRRNLMRENVDILIKRI